MTAKAKTKTAKTLKEISKEHKLTPKLALFYHEWLNNGGNGVQAALKVYDTTDYMTAGQIAMQNLKKLQNPMKFYMEYKGVGFNSILGIAQEAMTATKWNDFTGEREPDYNIRLKAVDRMSKWAELDPKKDSKNQTNIQNNIQVEFGKYE